MKNTVQRYGLFWYLQEETKQKSVEKTLFIFFLHFFIENLYSRPKMCKERLAKCHLFNVQYQTLEVFTFRMVDADGMVGGLGELVQYAHSTARHGSCGKYCCAEVVLRYDL